MITSIINYIPNPQRERTCLNTFGKGKRIYRQGDIAEGFYLLKSGSVKLQKMLPNGESTIIQIVTEGQIFGQKGFHQSKNVYHTHFAVALEENTTIEKISCISSLPEQWVDQILNHLAELAAINIARYERVITMEAEARICFYMKELAQRMGKRYGDETLLKVNLTHQEWALYTDTSRQTVTQTLSKLKREGLITYSRNRILFRNLETF